VTRAADDVSVSKLMSLALRHRPEELGLVLDGEGWTGVRELLAALAARGVKLSPAQLEALVARNDKQRFALSPDRCRIRANQGHSTEVDLQLEPAVPPRLMLMTLAPWSAAQVMPLAIHACVPLPDASSTRTGISAQL